METTKNIYGVFDRNNDCVWEGDSLLEAKQELAEHKHAAGYVARLDGLVLSAAESNVLTGREIRGEERR